MFFRLMIILFCVVVVVMSNKISLFEKFIKIASLSFSLAGLMALMHTTVVGIGEQLGDANNYESGDDDTKVFDVTLKRITNEQIKEFNESDRDKRRGGFSDCAIPTCCRSDNCWPVAT